MFKKLMMLATLSMLMTGCKWIHTTETTKLPKVAEGTRPPVCVAWKGITYSAKNDTAETVAEVRQNNAARDSYCRPQKR